MPTGEMTEPLTEGLTEMPSGEDPGMVGQPARSPGAQTGLMPGEEAAQAGSRAREMPGGPMSRMD